VISVRIIPRTHYAGTLSLQRQLHASRVAGEIGDVALITEHEPVITLGRTASEENILVPDSVLAQRGIPVFCVERGGNVTYHGPGQLVIYPIVDIRAANIGVRAYIWALEEAVIRLMGRFRAVGRRRQGFPGVWSDEAKIASIGVGVSRWVTMHGVALNVDVDLGGFNLIRPCGLESVTMTSLSQVLGRPVSLGEVEWECPSIVAHLLEYRAT
jgi:lipoate-protein ligase B